VLMAGELYAQNQQKIDSLKLSLLEANTSKEKISVLLTLTEQLASNMPDKALEYAVEANKLALENDFHEANAKTLNHITKIYRQKIDFVKALNFANQAYDIAEKYNYKEAKFNAMINLGYIYNQLGDYNTSSDYFFQCLKISEELGNEALISQSLNSIGYAYFDQHNFEKALEYYLKSLTISRKIENKIGISVGLNNVAAVYSKTGELDTYKNYIIDAIRINQEIDQKKYLTINYINLGFYYQEKDNYDSSLYFYRTALSLAEKMDYFDLILNIKINMASYMFLKGDIDQSLNLALEVYTAANDYQLTKSMHAAAKLLSDIYISKADYKNAFTYSNLQYQLKDSLDLNNKLTELSKLELLYDIEKNRQQEKFKQQRQEFIFIIGTLLLLTSLGYVLLLLKRQKLRSKVVTLERQKFKDELDFKKKELTTLVMSLIKKNEMLGAFSSQLLEIEKEAVKDKTKSAINRISRGLHKNIENEIWEDFELRFKEVHSDFYTKLIQTFPDLTPNEQRLSAFLKLNMSTKEISELTGQSTKAIEMARYRLRIKLNISGTDENLIAFLSQI